MALDTKVIALIKMLTREKYPSLGEVVRINGAFVEEEAQAHPLRSYLDRRMLGRASDVVNARQKMALADGPVASRRQ